MTDQDLMKIKDNASVISHVELMQGIINRMAGNSAKCKEWCFALVGVLMVFIFSKDNRDDINFNIIYYIIGIFCVLDAFYLGLERNHRSHMKRFIKDLNEKGDAVAKDLFLPYGADHNKTCLLEKFFLQFYWTLCSLASFSILIPYGLMFLAIWIFSPESVSLIKH